MKADGSELKALQNRLDVSPEEVCTEANVCISTLYKAYRDKPVSRNTVDRVRKALVRLQERKASWFPCITLRYCIQVFLFDL